jgi:hypothetical protein
MRRVTNMPLDIHLMCEDPEFIYSKIQINPGDIISTHVELKKDFTEFAADVHAKGGMFGVVVNPDTPVDSVAPQSYEQRRKGYTFLERWNALQRESNKPLLRQSVATDEMTILKKNSYKSGCQGFGTCRPDFF